MNIIKQIFFRITATIFISIICFAIAELLVRNIHPQPTGPSWLAWDPQLGAVSVPNQRGRRTLPGVYDYTYSHNSYGLRGSKEYSLGKSSNFRILLLGDSFTYGHGVNNNQTFAHKIEKRLSTAKHPIEVINAGLGGKGTDYALKFFQTLGHRFNPDLTILCFFYNDFYDNEYSIYYSVSKTGTLSAKLVPKAIIARKKFLSNLPLYAWLIRRSHFINLLKQTAIRIMVRRERANKATSHGVLIYYPNNKGGFLNDHNKGLTRIFIRYLKESTQNSESDFIIFYILRDKEIKLYRKTHKFSKEELAIKDIAKSQDIQFLSLTPILFNSGKTIDQLYYPEGHWAPLAHSIAAEFMSYGIEYGGRPVK